MTEVRRPQAADDRDCWDELLRTKAIDGALAGLALRPIDKIIVALAAGFGANSDDFKTRIADLVRAGCLDEDAASSIVASIGFRGRKLEAGTLPASVIAELERASVKDRQ